MVYRCLRSWNYFNNDYGVPTRRNWKTSKRTNYNRKRYSTTLVFAFRRTSDHLLFEDGIYLKGIWMLNLMSVKHLK